MRSIPSRKSHSALSAALAALVVLACGGILSYSQTASTASTQAQPAAPGTDQDPTKPETQPPLDVDRDPIPSPDLPVAATPAPLPSTSSTKTPHAPSEITKQQNGMYVLHANVDEVLLNCAVIDARGQVVEGLDKENFRVWENGVPETINSVQHMDLPVSMGILVDDSGSMRDKRAAVNTAALNMLSVSNPQDEAFIVNFSDRAYLDQRLTTDRVALRRGIWRFDSAGTTALYDAVAASADELAKDGRNRKQVLVIITDGADNASRLSLQEAIRRVQNLGGPVVYTIGLLFDTDAQESGRARNALESLSAETGGIAYFPRSLEEVNTIAAEVASDIRHQYVVDYHSSTPFSLGGYRSVRVEASAPRRGPLYVRTKRGYFAQTAQPKAMQQQADQ
jgi:Ca-activated chloride channel homolog